MLTDFARDHAYSIAWLGLMTVVWLGWAQEDPPPSWRWKLGAGSVLGIAFAGLFGYGVFIRWGDGSALDGRFHWFGVLVAAEFVAAGVGCWYLARTGRGRWMAWWVALVVAAHFLPLALLLEDPSLAVLAVVQIIGLGVIVPRLRRSSWPTSRLAGPVMGVTLLVFAAVSTLVFLATEGAPW